MKWVPSNDMKSIIKIVSLGFLILFIDFFNVFHEDDGNIRNTGTFGQNHEK